MKKLKFLITAGIILFLFTTANAKIIIKANRIAIYTKVEAPYVIRFSAKELQKHFSLIFSKEPSIIHDKNLINDYDYIFYIGIKDPADNKELLREECRYSIYKTKTYLYGDDSKDIENIDDLLSLKKYYTGTLNGVYLFLENELNVDWIAPGDAGIVYPKMRNLGLKITKVAWQPPLSYRDIWQTAYSDKGLKKSDGAIPKRFEFIDEEYIAKRRKKESLFFRRLKLGSRKVVSSHHAFSDYWQKYKDSHPNWFALNKNGERKPLGIPKYMKMCLTADGLVDHVVDEWYQKWLKNPNYLLIYASENDGAKGYCRCDKCKALDVELPEDKELKWDKRPKSDRYVWFWNQISKKAITYTPDVLVTVYIYSTYRYPPRKQQLIGGILGGFVPRFYDTPDQVQKMLEGWCKMGLKNMFIRPNDFNDDIGMPTGNEKYIFERFHNSWITAQKYGVKVFGISYDRNYSYNDYEVNGLAFYMIAKAANFPYLSFNEIADKYYQAYGPAQQLIKSFFEYWRNKVFYKRRYPDRNKVLGFEGRLESFAHISNYYKKEDFEKAKAILLNALQVPGLRAPHIEHINRLLWDLECKYAEFKAVNAANNMGNDMNRITDAVREMTNLRYKYRDRIFSAWHRAFKIEKDLGDATGLERSILFGNLSLFSLPSELRFKIDPENVGTKEKWFSLSAEYTSSTWTDFIDITTNWEAGKGNISAELKKKLKKYNGTAWYYLRLDKNMLHFGKKHYLLFGSVDESCWVYVNGKLAGKHLFVNADDWKVPFKIRIDQCFVENEDAVIFIKVEDKARDGGIWKKIALGIEN